MSQPSGQIGGANVTSQSNEEQSKILAALQPAETVKAPFTKQRVSIKERVDKFLLSRFYGTEQFWARYSERIKESAKESLTAYDALPESCFGGEKKAFLRNRVWYHAQIMASVSIWWDAVAKIILRIVAASLSLLFGYIVIASVLRASAVVNNITPSKWGVIWAILGILYGFILVILIQSLQSQKNRLIAYAPATSRFVTSLKIEMVFIFCYGIGAWLIIHGAHHHISEFWSQTMYGFRQGVLFSLADAFSSLGLITSAFLFLRWRNSKHPDTVIVNNALSLLSILTSMDKNLLLWTTLQAKRDYMKKLEEMASCYENYLPANLSSRDVNIQTWQKRMFRQVANSVRELNMCVVLPKEDTRENLIARVADLAEHSLRGDWDALDRREGEASLTTPTMGARIAGIARTVLQASIVPGGVYAFHILKPHENIPAFLMAIAVGWPVITLLAGLDPDIKSKLEMLRNAIQIIPSSNEKKDKA